MKIVLIAVACFCLSLSYGNADSPHSCNLTSCYSTNAVVCQNGSCSNGMVLKSVSLEGGAVKIQYNSNVFNGIARPQLPHFSVLNICEEKSMSLTSSDLTCNGKCDTTFIDSLPRTEWFKVTCDTETDLNFVRDTRMWKIVFFNSSCKPDVPNFFVLVDTREVNECDDTSKHNCPQNAKCIDEECGYSCQCNDGYQLASDNSTCLFIPSLSIEFDQPSYTFSESTKDTARIRFHIIADRQGFDGDLTIQGTVHETIIPITATEKEDYTYNEQDNLQFALNNAESKGVDIEFEVIDDTIPEGPESMTLHIVMTVPNYNITLENMTTIIIVDDIGFAAVPMPMTALLYSNNVTFLCETDPFYSVSDIEWLVNGTTQQSNGEVTIESQPHNRSIYRSSILVLPPILKFSNAEVVCKLIFKSADMRNSNSDPALLKLQYVTLELQVEQTVVREDVGMLNVYVVVRSNMLEGKTNHSITVNVSTIPESAQESGRETPDYRLVQTSITFTSLAPGNSSAVSIEIVDDNRTESNETFSIHLNTSDPGVFIEVSNVRVTIIDNDLIRACPSDVDVWNIKWKTANVSSTSKAPCPHQGVATRFCNSEGKWEDTFYNNCTSDRLSIIENNAKSLTENKNLTAMERKNILNDIVVDLIKETNDSLVPPSLQSIIRSLESVTDTLEQINSTDERVIEIFNNLLDQSQYEGWTNLQKDGHLNGSEILLDNAERYAKTLTTSPNQTLPVTLSRSNIVVNGREYSDPPSTDIAFPSNSDMVNYTTNRNVASIKIPPSLIKDNLQDDKKVPVSFVLFRYVPTTTSLVNESTSVASSVISAQVGRTSIPLQSSALVADPVILNFGFDEIGNTSSYVCVFWNFSEPIGSGGWITDGVKTQCVSESGNQTNVMCTSTHLTSFAVLVDITGALGKASKAERLALNIVSYIGCCVSIVCLLITVLFFLFQGKRLFEKVHHFVHLNLALSLLMANVLFVSGVEVAAKDEIACKVIAAILHYLFLTAFCWMLCEGIMLYLLLVVVFGNMANKLWLFMIIGYVLPLPIVIVTAAVRYPYYGVTDECGNLLYCWLSSEEGTIYGFVAPMLAVIVVNVLFLLIALRVLWKSKKQQLNRSKENTTVTLKTARAVLLASVVLLPLLGVTWTFGILNVNRHTTVFPWLFTIFNSLQGAFIFFFHVIRSEPVQNKIGSRIKTMTGTLRSRYTVSSRWFSSENTSTVIGRNTTRNGNHSTCATDDVVVMDEEPKVVDEPPEVKDPTPPPEKTSHVYRYQSETISEPGMEYVLADGTVGTEKQIELNTHKLTVLKINQLLRRTRKLLATHQESPEEIKMETPVKLTNGTTETATADDVFADSSNV